MKISLKSTKFVIMSGLGVGLATLNIPHVAANEYQLPSYESSLDSQTIAQVTSITQLRDVSSRNWSFEALKNLVEGYGCIEGYPDRTYRGDRALSRDEFAAGLNACLEAMENRLMQQKPPVTVAPTQPTDYTGISSQDMINRAFFNDTGTFYDVTNLSGQANKIFGWRNWQNSFMDTMIADDAELLGKVYQDMMNQQMAAPTIRTRDLPNPYDTSVFENPDYIRTLPPPAREIRF